MTQQEHNQQYIDQLKDPNQVPFLCLTIRLNEYPDGKYFGIYSSFENLGIDRDVAMKAIDDLTKVLKKHWDLPTKAELEVAKSNGEAMQTARYGGIQYNGQGV